MQFFLCACDPKCKRSQFLVESWWNWWVGRVESWSWSNSEFYQFKFSLMMWFKGYFLYLLFSKYLNVRKYNFAVLVGSYNSCYDPAILDLLRPLRSPPLPFPDPIKNLNFDNVALLYCILSNACYCNTKRQYQEDTKRLKFRLHYSTDKRRA